MKVSIKTTITFFSFAASMMVATHCQAQASFFDPTFGSGGKTILGGGGSFSAVALQSDGKIVVSGLATGGRIGRFKQNGTVDSSFAVNGFYPTPITQVSLKDLVIQPDGKIIAIGRIDTAVGNTNIVAFRLHPSGLADTSFGIGGVAVIDYEGYNDYGHSISLQADGKVLLAGQFTSNQAGIVRLNVTGMVDSSFGVNGIVIAGYDDAYYVDVAPDGKIVLGGTSSAAHDYTICAMRFLINGAVDTSFNHTGVVYTAAGDFRSNNGRAVKVQPDGTILVSGSGTYGSEGANFVVVRYNTDGSLDNAFGFGGIVNLDFDDNNDFAGRLELAPTGRIILAGGTGSDKRKIAIASLQGDGTLDASWGNAGRIIAELRDKSDYGGSIALQPDGKVIVAGSSYYGTVSGEQDPAIVRFTPLPVGVNDNVMPQKDLLLYPNPASSIVYFEFPMTATVNIRIMDIAGKLIDEQRLHNVGKAAFEVTQYAPGLYIYEVISNGHREVGKVVIGK